MGAIQTWGSSAAERAEPFPCDDYSETPRESLFRAVDVRAPCHLTFQWLCQLRVAPYSYDWIDNFGCRSPRVRDPRNEQLAVGQRWMTIFRLLDFEVDRHLTLEIDRTRVFGKVVVSYVVRASPSGSRVIVKLNLRLVQPLRWLLSAGDLIMMRKQLLTLKRYAEREYASLGR